MPFIDLNNVSLDIPVFGAGELRLFRKPALNGRGVGSNFDRKKNRKVIIHAVSNINLKLSAGDKIALIGHNGAGKSTLLKLMAGLYQPSAGIVNTSGDVGALLDARGGLLEDITGFECIRLNCVYRKVDKNDVPRIVADIEEFSQLGDYLSLPVRTYSKGMRSRLICGIVTSFHHNILLLDEGIGAGDATFKDKLKARIDKYIRTAQILVLASHSNDLLRQYCDTGLVLKAGEIAFKGPIKKALAFYGSDK